MAKILSLFAAPLVDEKKEPLVRLDVETERTAIIDILNSSNKEGEICFDVATTANLMNYVPMGFEILHYSGHGHEEFLAFEDGRGGMQPVNGKVFEDAIRMAGSFKLGIVSACHSENIARSLVAGGVPHVIAIELSQPVMDFSAKVFIEAFLNFLLSGQSVNFAYTMAKMVVQTNPQLDNLKPSLEEQAKIEGEEFVPEEEKFILLPKEPGSAIHEQVLFPEEATGMFRDISKKHGKTNIRSMTEEIVGRARDLYQVVNDLFNRKLVSILGAPGIGKSTLAIEAGKWFLARRLFRDGIYFFDLRGASKVDEVFAQVKAEMGLEAAGLEGAIEELGDKSMLLILDNLETSLRSDPLKLREMISRILKGVSRLSILVTTQEPIQGVVGVAERERRLGPISKDDSIFLLRRLAPRTIQPEELTSDEFGKILQVICGHPFSVGIIARQIRSDITLEDIWERIQEYGVKAVCAPGTDLSALRPEESLEITLLSGYQDCSGNARKALHFLALLPAGIDDSYIEGVLKGTDAKEESLIELVRKGLAERDVNLGRYFLLSPIQLFGKSKIDEGEEVEFEFRIYKLLLGLLYTVGTQWEKQRGLEAQAFFFYELPNFTEVLNYRKKVTEDENFESYIHIFEAILLHADYQGLARSILEKVKSNMRELYDASVRIARIEGEILVREHKYVEAEDVLRSTIEKIKDEDKGRKSLAYDDLVDCLIAQDQLEKAAEAQKECQKYTDEYENEKYKDEIDPNLAMLVFLTKGSVGTAEDMWKVFEDDSKWKTDNYFGQGWRWVGAGIFQYHNEDYVKAKECYKRAFENFERINAGRQLGEADIMLAILELFEGNLEDADKRIERADRYFRQKENIKGMRDVYLFRLLKKSILDSEDLDETIQRIIELTKTVGYRYEVIRHLESFVEILEEKGKSKAVKILKSVKSKIIDMIPEELRIYI